MERDHISNVRSLKYELINANNLDVSVLALAGGLDNFSTTNSSKFGIKYINID